MENFILLDLFLMTTMYFCNAAHFRGGTISWKPLGGNKVEFKFKLAFSYGAGPGCTETKIGQYVQNNFQGYKSWMCVSGCPNGTAVGTVYYYCTAADKQENWEQGENTFEYAFSGKGPFVVSYVGSMWMVPSVPFSDYHGTWNLQTIVQLEQRSDTKLPNSSPITASKQMYTLQYQCKHELQLPMVDPDGDRVKCRWAKEKECDSICNGVPVAKLEESTCTLKFEAENTNFKNDGWYAVALTIEDFPKKPMTIGNTTYDETTPITQVPLQFLIHIVQKPLDCALKPLFVPPTPPNGSHISVAENDSVHTRLYASNERNVQANVTAISLTSPYGMTHTGPFPDQSRSGVVYWELQWTPSQAQTGDNILCAMAEDSSGQHSDQYCFNYIAFDHDPCAIGPCNNNGTCDRKGSTQNYYCFCPGFTGTLCETEINECASVPCQHLGTCSDDVNGFICTCIKGYSGLNCETDINECANFPCKHDGSCTDGVNSYTCSCKPGYTGANCETDIDECHSNPCSNGSACHDQVNGYVCSCVPGYTYVCSCMSGYTGKDFVIDTTTTNVGLQRNQSERHDVSCNSDSMSVFIPLTLLSQNETLSWRDPHCTVTNNGTHYVSVVSHTACGTTVKFTDSEVIFENDLIIRQSTSLPVSSHNDIVDFGGAYSEIIPVKCVYPRRQNVTTAYIPAQTRVRFFEKRYGHMDVELEQYHSDKFDTVIRDITYPREVPINQDMYIKLHTIHNSSDIAIKVDSCVATPSIMPADGQLYPLIDHGCPASPAVKLYPSAFNEVKFSVHAFEFKSSPGSVVYIHCQISVCLAKNPQCVVGCRSRQRREVSAADDSSHLVSGGPYLLVAEQGSVQMATIVAAVCACLAVVATIVAAVGWRRKLNAPKHDSKLISD